jgi:ribosomal protein L11 methylase PrmA
MQGRDGDGPDGLGYLRGPFAGTENHLDAPYAQTSPAIVEAMLDLAEIRPGERLLDLGCGDGRIVIAAAHRGAHALGVDIDSRRIAEAEAAALAAGVSERTRFCRGDLFSTPLGEAEVITLYLLPHVNGWLRPRLIAEARPGTRIVSHAFPMAQWEATVVRRLGNTLLYLWIAGA